MTVLELGNSFKIRANNSTPTNKKYSSRKLKARL